MNGIKFISSLKRLEVPGIENLSVDDFDYIFIDPQYKPLSDFLEYFFSNVSLNDKLSSTEITNYEELLSNGQIMEGKHMEEMELYLEPFMAELETPSANEDPLEYFEDEIDHLENRLQILNKRKSFLNLQKIAESESLSEKKHHIQYSLHKLEKTKSLLESVAKTHSNAVNKLSHILEKASANFVLLEKDENEKKKFLSQLPIYNWQQKETEFGQAVEAFIEKQFKEGVDIIAGQKDSAPHSIIDSGQLDMQLVRGPGQAEYLKNVKELNRVSKMLEVNEVEAVRNEVQRNCHKVKMEEALKLLKMVKTKSVIPGAIQRQNCELEEIGKAIEQDLQFQMTYLENQALKVAQLERMKTISGNYEVKLQRQEYFLSKQEMVISFLSNQLSHFDFMKIALTIEKENIDTALQVLIKMNKLLVENQQRFLGRMHYLNKTKDRLLLQEDSEEICEELLPMAKLLTASDCQSKENYAISDISSLLKNLEASIKESREKVNHSIQKQASNIMNMCNACMLLEECLFGRSSGLGSLPASWLPNDLIDRQANIEQNLWEFQQGMVKVIQDYEEKKKILLVNPTMKDLLEWTNTVLRRNPNQ